VALSSSYGRAPVATLFPYTTLFRSVPGRVHPRQDDDRPPVAAREGLRHGAHPHRLHPEAQRVRHVERDVARVAQERARATPVLPRRLLHASEATLARFASAG